ncbi:AfsR/SARP family transcriptional regulator, partial [Spirillospora sp. NPDC049652]
RLDGLPLALELAATRVRAMGVRQLAAGLDDRFGLLVSGRRAEPVRQQTLRAVIDWSWDLLSVPERTLLRRLAVHADGCTLAAAREVCAGGEVTAARVPDLLARLVDRSLVVMAEGPDGPRYRLLESVAAYALERLDEAEDLAATRDRHLRHYLALAEAAEPRLRDGGQRAWLARLDADAANLRAALEEASPDGAARLTAALTWWWLLRGRFHEARGVLAEHAPGGLFHTAFALLTGDHTATAEPRGCGRAVWLYAYALFHAGRADASREANARAQELFTETGDRWGTAAALALRAMHAMNDGGLAEIADAGGRAAALFRDLGDQWGELQTVPPLAVLAEVRGVV